MAIDHYENFPVASILLPRRLRQPVEAIYLFARSADDIADEGEMSAAERLALLAAYHRELDAIADRRPPLRQDWQHVFTPLRQAVCRHDLPLAPLHDLLFAFEQDAWKSRYADFGELLDYCRRSANPVGRLLLHLYDAATPDNLIMSDRICTSLQLINFWQDVAIDWRKDRVYLPQDDMRRFGVTERHIADHRCDEAWTALLSFQIERSRAMMLTGAPLALRLPGRIGWELRLIVLGGLRILERIERYRGDVFRRRPVLGKTDWLILLWRALRYHRSAPETL